MHRLIRLFQLVRWHLVLLMYGQIYPMKFARIHRLNHFVKSMNESTVRHTHIFIIITFLNHSISRADYLFPFCCFVFLHTEIVHLNSFIIKIMVDFMTNSQRFHEIAWCTHYNTCNLNNRTNTCVWVCVLNRLTRGREAREKKKTSSSNEILYWFLLLGFLFDLFIIQYMISSGGVSIDWYMLRAALIKSPYLLIYKTLDNCLR